MRPLLIVCGLILVCLLLTDAPEEGASIPDAGAPGVGSMNSLDCIFAVRAVDGNSIYSGTAESLGDGLLVTAAHVVEKGRPSVRVGDTWVPANASFVKGRDVAYLTINDTSLPKLTVRKPQYGERVTVFGLRTQRKMGGIVSGIETVSIDANEMGIDQGDSGGPVFGEDGCLIGVTRARNPGEWRMMYLTELDPPVPFALSETATNPPKNVQTNLPAAGGGCIGGQCPVPQRNYYGKRKWWFR